MAKVMGCHLHNYGDATQMLYKTNVLFCLVVVRVCISRLDTLVGFEEISCRVMKGPVRTSHGKELRGGH